MSDTPQPQPYADIRQHLSALGKLWTPLTQRLDAVTGDRSKRANELLAVWGHALIGLPRQLDLLMRHAQSDQLGIQIFLSRCHLTQHELKREREREREETSAAEPFITEEEFAAIAIKLGEITACAQRHLDALGGAVPEAALEVNLQNVWGSGGSYDYRLQAVHDACEGVSGGARSTLWNLCSSATGFDRIIEAKLSVTKLKSAATTNYPTPAAKRDAFQQKKDDFIAAVTAAGYPVDVPANAERFQLILDRLDDAIAICEAHMVGPPQAGSWQAREEQRAANVGDRGAEIR